MFEFVYAPGASLGGVSANSGSESTPIVTSAVNLKLIDSIPVGDNPEGIVIDAKAQVVLVANSGSDDVTIIDISEILPKEALQDVSTELQDIINSNPGTPLADKIEDALDKIQTALDELDKTPPDNQAAVGNIEDAVGDLEAAIGLDPAQDPTLTDRMDQLAGVARQLATEALDQAIAQGGDPTAIADAQQALAEGDTLRASGAFKDAVSKYKDALAKAESA